jgi:hypothetical protein
MSNGDDVSSSRRISGERLPEPLHRFGGAQLLQPAGFGSALMQLGSQPPYEMATRGDPAIYARRSAAAVKDGVTAEMLAARGTSAKCLTARAAGPTAGNRCSYFSCGVRDHGAAGAEQAPFQTLSRGHCCRSTTSESSRVINATYRLSGGVGARAEPVGLAADHEPQPPLDLTVQERRLCYTVGVGGKVYPHEIDIQETHTKHRKLDS